MLNKIIDVLIELIFPKTYLERFLMNCSQIEFEFMCTPRAQFHKQMFYPFHYKNNFTKDCIIELKERNNRNVARLCGGVLAKWIVRKVREIDEGWPRSGHPSFYLIPIPQHISKTKEKGFCHTTTLTHAIHAYIKKFYPEVYTEFKACIVKESKTKKLHNTHGKKKRFSIIKNSMRGYITKQDNVHSYFFLIDDVYTTGATFKEARRGLLDCGVPSEHIFFISIAH